MGASGQPQIPIAGTAWESTLRTLKLTRDVPTMTGQRYHIAVVFPK